MPTGSDRASHKWVSPGRHDVVYTAGPQDVPLPINSVRKSVISALFGRLGGHAVSVIPSHGLVIVAMSDNRKGGNSRMAIPDAVVNAALGLDTVVSLES